MLIKFSEVNLCLMRIYRSIANKITKLFFYAD